MMTSSKFVPDPPGGEFREELEQCYKVGEKVWKFNETPICDCDFFFHKTYNIANTVKNLIIMMKEATEHLQKQNTTSGPRTIRDKVYHQLQHITMHIEKLDTLMEEFLPSPPPTHTELRLENIENDIKEIKAALNLSSIEADNKDLKATFHETLKTWANVVTNTNTEAAPLTVKAHIKRCEIQEKLRKELELYEVILTTSNKETKEELNAMHTYKIMEQCQILLIKTQRTNQR